MGFRLLNTRVLAVFVAAGFMSAVAGCKSDDAGSVLDPGTGANTAPPEGKVLESELRAYCPPVELDADYAVYSTYDKKADGDATKLIYQSSITAVTRKCTYAAGVIMMDIAAAGRVVPGPLATDGTVSMPFIVSVTAADGTSIYSNKAKYDVAVTKASGAAQFIYHDPNVSIPTPKPGTIKVTIGYDLPKKKPSGDLSLQ